MSLIELQNVSAGYGKNVILKDFCINIEEGKLVSLLGPSGCGKTTTLRTMAGFIDVLSGKFLFDGKDFSRVPIAFGLKERKTDKQEIQRRVMEMLERVNLNGFEKRLPAEMSGGQRQRVALARALVLQPKLLLLDEPLSNLDAKLRVEMRVEIRRLQQETGITTVYVTHDQEECFSISDQVAIMNGGKIQQMDAPETIYSHPANEFTARFVGFENFIPLKWDGSEYRTVSGGEFHQPYAGVADIKAACRPEDIAMEAGMHPGERRLHGHVLVRTFLGKQLQYLVETPEGNFLVNTQITDRYEIGDQVTLFFAPEKTISVTA